MLKVTLRLVYLLCAVICIACKTNQAVLAQDKVQEIDKDYLIEGKFEQFEKDKLDNLYLFTSNNEILKYDSSNKLEFKNSFNKYGKIKHLDVTNPQKILVYFSDYQYIVFLDNTLSEIKTLSLEELGYWDIQGVAMGVDNFLWIYDPVNFKLVKINDAGKVQLASNELYSDIFDTQKDHIKIYADNNRVLLYNKSKVKVFNVFGEEQKSIQIENNGLQVFNNFLIYNEDGKLLREDLDLVRMDDKKEVLTTIPKSAVDFQLDKEGCLVLDGHGIYRLAI